MAPQQDRVLEVEGVLLVGGRVVQRRVEGLEVVPLRVGLRAAHAGEPEPPEDPPDLVHGLGDRVPRAHPPGPPRQGEVLGGGRGRTGQRPLPLLQRLGDHALHPVGLLAHLRPHLRGHVAQPPEDGGDRPVLPAEVRDPHRLEGVRVLRRAGGGQGLLLQRPQGVHEIDFAHFLPGWECTQRAPQRPATEPFGAVGSPVTPEAGPKPAAERSPPGACRARPAGVRPWRPAPLWPAPRAPRRPRESGRRDRPGPSGRARRRTP